MMFNAQIYNNLKAPGAFIRLFIKVPLWQILQVLYSSLKY